MRLVLRRVPYMIEWDGGYWNRRVVTFRFHKGEDAHTVVYESKSKTLHPFGTELGRLLGVPMVGGRSQALRGSMLRDMLNEIRILDHHDAARTPEAFKSLKLWSSRINDLLAMVRAEGLSRIPTEPTERLDELLAAYKNADRCEWATPPFDPILLREVPA